jgi:DNA invertase Pin-like site-specific DNA recombinase
LHKQALDTSTAAGRAMFGMVSVFAEFEADIIKERVKAGLARARAQGKWLGRSRVNDAIVHRISEQLAGGSGIIKTAKLIGCGVGTVHRIRREMAVKDEEAVRQINFGDWWGPQGPVNTISDEKSTTTNYPCLRGRTTTEN